MTEDDLILAHGAERLLNEPLIVQAFDTIAARYVKAWQNSTPAEADKRELAYAHYKAVLDVRGELERRKHDLAAFRAKQAHAKKSVEPPRGG